MRLPLTSGMLKKVGVAFVALTSLAFQAKSQTLLLMSEDSSFTESRTMLEASGELDYRSNRLTNAFTDKFIFGGEIDEELKDDVRDNGNEKFRFGGGASAGIRFFNFADTIFKSKPNLGMMVNVSTHWHARASFSENFYELAMYGNRHFAGTYKAMESISADYLAWQQAGVGIFHKPTLSYVSVNVINGQSFSSFLVSDAGVNTTPEGDEITIGLAAEMNESDTLLSGYGVSNGVGSVINARLNLPLKEDRGFVSLRLNDFGFINWNEYTLTREAQEIYTFSGVDVAEVFSDENEVQFPSLQDSLFEETTVGQKTTFLPARISATLNHRLSENGFYTAGIEFITVAEYIPLGRVGYSHFLTDRMLVGLNAEYGGFGNFRAGAQFQWWTKSNWYLQVRINDLAGMFLPEAKGRGAQVVVSKFFKSRDDRERTQN